MPTASRTAKFLLAGAMGAAGLTFASASAASAACDDYFLCVYQYHDYEGGALFTSQSNSNWDYYGNPTAFKFMNDKMSSVKNRTSRTYAIVAEHDNLEGYQYCVTPGANRPNVNNEIENKSSSHQFFSAC